MDRRAKIGLSALTIFAALVLLAVTTRTYAPKTGTIVSTGAPRAARFSHTATLLADNRVLIAGGMERNGYWLNSAEIYNPETGQFSPTRNMLSRRAGAMAVRLPNSKVLIAGGTDGSGTSLRTTEIYDPASNIFAPGPIMLAPRAHGVAIRLKDGRVLIAGGCAQGDDERLASAEIYDPATQAFSWTGSMHVPRGAFNAVALADGRVLVTGGMSSGQLPDATVEATAEIYNPATGRFTLTSPMAVPRYKHGIALLKDGRALIIGGQTSGSFGPRLTSTEFFDPETSSFSRGPEMKYPRFKLIQGVAALSDGHVLVAGGADQPEMYDPHTEKFVPVSGPVIDGYFFSTATVLDDDTVLLVDGYGKHTGGGAVRQAWLWQP
ncbi:MAG TPA: kelch repeat-containing protein [Candidatus Angelobacter sp.]|nr:kelch repeat-containing protein [Candidatus Angelobacter sp.]